MKSLFYSLLLLFSVNLSATDYVLTVDSPTVSEIAGTVSVNIRIEPKLSPSDVITINYATQDGTASGGADYQILSGNAVINNSFNLPSSTEFSVDVTIIDDTLVEGDEAFDFLITSASTNSADDTVTINSASGGLITIEDNEAGSLPTLSVSNTTVDEDVLGATATITVSLDATSAQDVSFTYVTVDGNATQGDDYTASSGSGSISAGSLTTTFTVPIIDDIVAGETSEYFYVYLSNVVNANSNPVEGTVTIIDNDIRPSVSITNAFIGENDTNTTVTAKIILSHPSEQDFNITLQTVDGTATAGSDYTALSSFVVLVQAGMTEVDVNVTIIGDDITESIEEFYLEFADYDVGDDVVGSLHSVAASGTTTFVLADKSSTITIFDDDGGSCSSYIGLMTINEYQNNPHYFDDGGVKVTGNYVEIKFLDFLVKQYINNDWSVSMYTTAGTQSILWDDRDLACVDPKYEVFQFDNNVMASQGYVVLTDHNGNEVDVLNIDGSNHYNPACVDGFLYDTDFESSAQNKDLFRDPDGTGDWFDTGSGANSEGSRCVDKGGGANTIQYTEFDAIDTDETFTAPVQVGGAATPIKTKIVNSLFGVDLISINLSTGGLNPLTDDLDVVVYLADFNGGAPVKLSAGTPFTFTSGGTGRITLPATTFNSSSAVKEAKILIEYCQDDAGGATDWATCYAVGSENPAKQIPAYSRNTFAIRPSVFSSNVPYATTIATAPIYTAADAATAVEFYAKDATSVNTVSYNETAGGSFTIDLDINDLTKVCEHDNEPILTGTSFIDGLLTGSTGFPYVGEFSLTIQETIGAEFALVDAGDTADTDRLITPWTTLVKVKPASFNFVSASYSDEGNNFTYVSKISQADSTMAATMSIDVQAVKADATRAENYTEDCYAEDTDLVINYDLTAITDNIYTAMMFIDTDNSETDANITFPSTPPSTGENMTLPLPKVVFDQGATLKGGAIIDLKTNFNRTTNQAVNPFRFTVNDLTLNDAVNTITGTQSVDENATFFYSRVHTPRNRAMCDGAGNCIGTVTLEYEVYAKQPSTIEREFLTVLGATLNRSRDSVNWYRNGIHTNNEGNVSAAAFSPSSVTLTPGTTTATTPVSYNYTGGKGYPYKGTVTVNAATNETQSWLIYDKFNAAATTKSIELEFYGPGTWSGSAGADESIDNAARTDKKKNTNRRIRW